MRKVDLVRLARERISEPQTHWEGCEADHRECLIQRMADQIEHLEASLQNMWVALDELFTQLHETNKDV